jgi:preprotein translocase SecE subunit
MARDRQRAKQRRRRQAAPPARGRTQRARDIGLDDAGIEESGLGGATPTPNPLDHSSADVDEALLAEAGAEPLDGGRAPDLAEELEATVAEEREAPTAAEPARRAGPLGRLGGFLAASWAELQRVQWPDRRQVGQGTAVVLGFVIIAGAYLGLLDAVINPLIQKIL